MLFVSSSGHGKRTKLDVFNRQGRGGQGVRGMKITASRGAVVAAFTVTADDEILVFSSGGNIIRMRRHGDLGAGSGRHRRPGRPARGRGDGQSPSAPVLEGDRKPERTARDHGKRRRRHRAGRRRAHRPARRRRPTRPARGAPGPRTTAADRTGPRPAAAPPAPQPLLETRRYRQTIHRVDLWSVLKISVCFYIGAVAVADGRARRPVGDRRRGRGDPQRREVHRRPAPDQGLHVPERRDPARHAARRRRCSWCC